jgi:hypothetical protein
MQQKEGSSFCRASCHGNNGLRTSEENTFLQFRYAQHDNESIEYDNNQETEFDSDASTCQKMNSLESDDERNMFTAFSKFRKDPSSRKRRVCCLEALIQNKWQLILVIVRFRNHHSSLHLPHSLLYPSCSS